jgi:hypothetical protein
MNMEEIMKMPLEEVINKIPKLYDDNYQFRITYINFGYSIGYIKVIGDDTVSHPLEYVSKSGETLPDALRKFYQMVHNN